MSKQPYFGTNWRVSEHGIFNGTMRIAKFDFDTCPNDEVKQAMYAEMLVLLKADQLTAAQQRITELETAITETRKDLVWVCGETKNCRALLLTSIDRLVKTSPEANKDLCENGVRDAETLKQRIEELKKSRDAWEKHCNEKVPKLEAANTEQGERIMELEAAIKHALECAGLRYMDWGERAEECFAILEKVAGR